MDTNTAAKFISSLTKSLQSLIHGCLDFESDIELGGYIYLRVDNAQKVDYVLNEKMQKNAVNSLTFFSNSFHAVPLGVPLENKSYSDITSGLKDQTQSPSHDNFLGLHKQTKDLGVPRQSQSTSSAKIKHFKSSEIHDNHMNTDNNIHLSGNSKLTDVSSKRDGRQDLVSNTQANTHTSSSTEAQSQPLADFQTAFHSSGNVAMKMNQNQDCKSNQSRASSLHHQHDQKAGLLPESGEMEVVYIKAEEEDEVFSIPLHPPGSEAADSQSKDNSLPLLSSSQLPSSVQLSDLLHQLPMPSSSQQNNNNQLGWVGNSFPQLNLPETFHLPQSLAASEAFHQGQVTQRGIKPLAPASVLNKYSRISCQLCGYVSFTAKAHARHTTMKHSKRGSFVCSQCGKSFHTSLGLTQHMQSHGGRRFECEICGKRFLYKHHLPRHQQAVHGKVTYSSPSRQYIAQC